MPVEPNRNHKDNQHRNQHYNETTTRNHRNRSRVLHGILHNIHTSTIMKNKHKTTSVLSALAYLIDRQGLTPDQIKKLVIKTAQEIGS